jgi:pimeloyl-ACP methyl ester carboxylesterase
VKHVSLQGDSRTDAAVSARRIKVAGVDTHLLEAGEGIPTFMVHGNPDSGDQWLTFLRRAGDWGKLIAPDLPGWGRSARPDPSEFRCTVDSLAEWFAALVDELAIARYRLVVHDWGILALAGSLDRVESLDRLVIVDVPPLLHWHFHWVGRLWRIPLVGEVGVNALRSRAILKLLSHQSSPRRGPMPDEWLDGLMRYIDRGTRRAILQLYRSADPDVLEAAGAGLSRIACPTQIYWGEHDPYARIKDGRRLSERIAEAEFIPVPDAGYWPFYDQPWVIDRIVGFLAANGGP